MDPMNEDIRIPLHFQPGVYPVGKLPAVSENFIAIQHEPSDTISYTVPCTGREVRLHRLSKSYILEHLTANYRENGGLYCVEIRDGDDVSLVYIHYLDEEDARNEIGEFIFLSSLQITKQLSERKDKMFRLFIEYFYNGENFDLAAVTASEKDKEALLASAGKRTEKPAFVNMLLNNSGNYPRENRIECDSHTISIMLRCSPCDLHEMVVNETAAFLKKRLVPKLDKTDDFKFIVSEYD